MRSGKKESGKRILAIALTLLMLIGYVPISEVAAYADFNVTVSVTNYGGSPIPGATVQLGTGSATTDAAGKASFTVLDDSLTELSLQVAAAGYVSYSSAAVSLTSGSIPVVMQGSLANLISAQNLYYNASEQPLLELTGSVPAGVSVTYTFNGATGSTIPTAKDCGTYSVAVRAEGTGFELFDSSYTVEILQGTPNISVTPYNAKFDGEEHELVKLNGVSTGDTVEYQLAGSGVTSECPKASNYGTYSVNVKVTPADSGYGVYNENVNSIIHQSDMRIIHYVDEEKENNFKNHADCVEELALTEAKADFGAVFDPSITEEKQQRLGLSIEYNTTALADTGILINSDTGVVTWNNNGKVTPAGEYTFTAEVVGTAAGNYTDEAKKLEYTLALYKTDSASDPLIKFEKKTDTYVLSDSAIPAQTAEKANADDNGVVTYSVLPAGAGIVCDSNTGALTIDADQLLELVKAAEANNGGVEFTITASKTAGTNAAGHKLYDQAQASYTLTVTPSTFTDEEIVAAYSLTGHQQNGWYTKNPYDPTAPILTVSAEAGYEIAGTNDSAYGGSTTFSESGDEHFLYIKNGGKASAKVNLLDENKNPVKIDTDEPTEFFVEYRGALWYKQVAEVVTLGVAKSGLTVALSAKDALSGVAEISWWFDGNSGLKYRAAGESELKDVPTSVDKAVTAMNGESSKNDFEYVFELKGNNSLLEQLKQYKGAIKASVTDRAGNTKDKYDKVTVYTTVADAQGDGNTIVVIDQLAPQFSNLTLPPAILEKDGRLFYNGSVSISFNITEANIEEDDVVLSVTKNGASISAPAITWSEKLTAGQEDDKTYTGTFTLAGSGYYTFSISAKDKADNALAGDGVTGGKFAFAQTVVIDTTAPKIELSYAAKNAADNGQSLSGNDYIKGDVVYTVKVTDNFLNFETVKITGKVELDGTKNSFPEKTFSKKDFKPNPDAKFGEETEYTATFTVSEEGEYALTAEYTDFVGANVTASTSSNPVIDTSRPVVSVVYADGKTQQYYNKEALANWNSDGYRAAKLSIVERSFDDSTLTGEYITKNLISAKDVTGTDVATDDAKTGVVSTSAWSINGNTHSMDVTFEAEANYVFDVKEGLVKDLAGNEAQLQAEYEKTFTVDRTAPNAPGAAAGTVQVSFNIEDANNGKQSSIGQWIESIINGIKFGFWKSAITVTVIVEDETAGVSGNGAVKYVYTRAQTTAENGKNVFVSDSNAETLSGTCTLSQESGSNRFVGTFSLPADVIDANSKQLDGTLEVKLQDLCLNESADNDVKTRLIFDTIRPSVSVDLPGAVNAEGNRQYYSGAIGVGINVFEANFFEDCVIATSNNSPVSVAWSSSDADNHRGTFTISGDGEYLVNVSGKDYAGNEMIGFQSGILVIDTKIERPEIQINGEPCDGKAYKDDAVLTVSFSDTNFYSIDIQILRTRLGEKNVDVTNQFIVGAIETGAQGGMAYIDTLSKTQDNDGIYTVIARVQDKAFNSATVTSTFTLNRFGSVYEYGPYLCELIKDGGRFVNGIDEDLTLTEYNADRIIDGSAKVEITKDGKLIKNPVFSVEQIKAGKSDRGEKGWFEYAYTISKDNFKEDGLYKIVVSSKDETGNRPENTNYKGMEIQFYVDTTAPEITSVSGLEKAIVNAEQVDVKFTSFDAIGLKSVKVYVDGELYAEIKDFSADGNNYNGGLTLLESVRAQSVRIVVEDLAGNITDTAAKEFTSAYTMVNSITVSTNFFARFYANKPLFWGSIGGVIALAGITGIVIPALRKRKAKSEQTTTR